MKRALVALLATLPAIASAAEQNPQPAWERIKPYFSPPSEFANDFGPYRSPLKFDDGTDVKTPQDWQRRRQEILAYWHKQMGEWPPVIEKPQVEWLEKQRPEGENFVRHKVRLGITPRHKTDGYVLVPDGKTGSGQGKRPAVLVVFYDPETAVGLAEGPEKRTRAFGYDLARRGFVVLSIGQPSQLYYPDQHNATLQPLSALAYAAANCYHVLASMPEVDPQRVGVTGHSYGGKWAMFASCLYDKFACSAWSDGGVVFDEKRSNVNYWEPWYLGYEPGEEPARKRGVVTESNPRTGAYKRLMEEKRDLHELHALMAPRPFLVSGGSEDPPTRWNALNHAVAVNKLLGHENRVAMTNRPGHGPTEESNEQMYLFFEWALRSRP